MRRIGQHIHGTQCGRIAAQNARCVIHQAFDDVIRFRLASTAISIHRQAIGESAAYFQMHGRYGVNAAHGRGKGIGWAMRPNSGKIGPHIRNAADFQRQKAPCLIERQPRLGAQIAAMNGSGEFLTRLCLPGNYPAKLTRRPKRQDIFRKKEVLGAETAAHIGTNEMKGFFRQAKYSRKLPANTMHPHAGENQLKPPTIKLRECGTRFNRRGMHAIIEKICADNVVCSCESRIGCGAITFQKPKGFIARCIRPDLRCISSKRAGTIDHGGQCVIADVNRLSRITRGSGAGRDYKGDRFAQMPHAIGGENWARWHNHGRDTGKHCGAGQRRQIIYSQIGCGKNTNDAGHGARHFRIDGAQIRMGMRRTQHHGMQRIRRQQISHIAALPGQKPRIFQPGDGLPAIHQAPLLRRLATNSSLS